MIKKISVLLFLMLCNFAFAANWVEISNKNYIDTTSHKKYKEHGSQYATAWIKEINSGHWSLVKFKKAAYRLDKTYADCTDKRLGFTSWIIYDSKGNALDENFSNIPLYDDVVPDSLGETIWERLCK